MTTTPLLSDNEPYTVYDQSARRQTYHKTDFNTILKIQSRKVKFVTAINFSRNDFEEGATQWYHLKEEPLSRFLSILNGLAYAMGNKRKFHLVASSTTGVTGTGGTGERGGSRKTKTDSSSSSAATSSSFTSILTEEDINVFVETLLSRNKKKKVFGYRLIVLEFDRTSSKASSLSSSMDIDNGLLQSGIISDTMTSSSSTSNTNRSYLYRGINDSFNECIEIVRNRWEKAIKMKLYQPPKGTVNIEEYKALDRTLDFMKAFTYSDLFMRVFSSYDRDQFRVSSLSSTNSESGAEDEEEGGETDKQQSKMSFVDNRQINEDSDVSTIFSIDSAMLYHVTNKIQDEQCDIKTYFKSTNDEEDDEDYESSPIAISSNRSSSGRSKGGVKYITHTSLKDSQFVGFFNQDTTYILPKEKLLPEYMVKMPLPHAIGVSLRYVEELLPTEEDENIRLAKEADKAYSMDNNDEEREQEEDNPFFNNANDDDDVWENADVIYGSDDNYPPTIGTLRSRGPNVQIEEEEDGEGEEEPERKKRCVVMDDLSSVLGTTVKMTVLDDQPPPSKKKMLLHRLKKKKKNVSPLGLHSTVYNPSSMEILKVPKQNGRFASLHYIKDDKDINSRSIHDYKKIIDDAVKYALGKSAIPSLFLKTSYFYGDYEKLRCAPLESIKDQPYYSNSPLSLDLIRKKGGSSSSSTNDPSNGPFASFLNKGGGHVSSDDEDDRDENDDDDLWGENRTEEDEKMQEFQEYYLDEMMKFDQVQNLSESERLERCYVASGVYLDIFKQRIGRYRSITNDYASVMKDVGHDTPYHTTAQLEKDVFCRLAELNTRAWRRFDAQFFCRGVIKAGLEKKHDEKRRELMEAMVVETFNEMLTSPDVTNACLAVRKHLTRLMETSKIIPGGSSSSSSSSSSMNSDGGLAGQKGIFLSTTLADCRFDARPYGQYRIWLQKFFTAANGLDVKSNYKNMDVIFHSRLHHCRHYVGLNLPAHMGVLIQGRHGCGKSFQLLAAALCSIPGVAESLVRFTKNALSVEGNKSDYFKILEELPPEFLGHSASAYSNDKHSKGGSNSGGGDNSKGAAFDGALSELASLLKAMLCAPELSVARGHWKQEDGKVYEEKTVALMQGVIMAALNYSVQSMEPALRDRFIHLLGTSSKDGKNAINSTPNMCQDHEQRKQLLNEAIDMHHVYFIVETMMKSNVLGVNYGYGVNMTVCNILLPLILDHLQTHFNINTENQRKRVFVEEMARIKTISSRVWHALKSPLFHHLFYLPQSKEDYKNGRKPTYIGFNLRVITEGIFPFLFVTKDELFCSLFSLNSLWQVDYLTEILKFLLMDSKMLTRFDDDANDQTLKYCFGSTVKKSTSGGGGGGQLASSSELEFNYDYIIVPINTRKEVYMKKIATHALEHKSDLSEKYVTKVIDDLCEEYDEELPTYRYDKTLNRIVRNETSSPLKRKIMELRSPPDNASGGGPTLQLIISLPYLKKRLPHILTDDIVEDLSKSMDEMNTATATATTTSPLKEGGGRTDNTNNISMDHFSPLNTEKREAERLAQQKKDDALFEIYEKIAAIDHERIENSMAKTIATICQNPALEKVIYLGYDDFGNEKEWGSDEIEKKFYDEYKNRYMTYTICEPIKEIVKISERYPTLPKLSKKMALQYDVVYFHHHIGTLTLKREENGELLRLENKNDQTPASNKALYENDFIGANSSSLRRSKGFSSGDGMKKNRALTFDKSAVFECEEDIDWFTTKNHFNDLGIKMDATIGDIRQSHLPFPTFHYMLLMEFVNRIRDRKWKLLSEFKQDIKEYEVLNYPRCDIDADLQRAYTQLQAKLFANAANRDLLKTSRYNKEKIARLGSLTNANFQVSEKSTLSHKNASTTKMLDSYKVQLVQDERYLKRKANTVEFFTMMDEEVKLQPKNDTIGATTNTKTTTSSSSSLSSKTTTTINKSSFNNVKMVVEEEDVLVATSTSSKGENTEEGGFTPKSTKITLKTTNNSGNSSKSGSSQKEKPVDREGRQRLDEYLSNIESDDTSSSYPSSQPINQAFSGLTKKNYSASSFNNSKGPTTSASFNMNEYLPHFTEKQH